MPPRAARRCSQPNLPDFFEADAAQRAGALGAAPVEEPPQPRARRGSQVNLPDFFTPATAAAPRERTGSTVTAEEGLELAARATR